MIERPMLLNQLGPIVGCHPLVVVMAVFETHMIQSSDNLVPVGQYLFAWLWLRVLRDSGDEVFLMCSLEENLTVLSDRKENLTLEILTTIGRAHLS